MDRFQRWRSTWVLVAALLLLLAGACSAPPAEEAGAETASDQWESYGEGVDLKERTEIAAILAKPDEFVDKTVAVEGTVVGVCKMMGCWIELEEDAQRMRIKVEDGVIVFPQESHGRRAVAQGQVERLSFSKEDYITRAQHQAQEQGEAFDPETIGDAPYEVIQIRGTGALIEKSG